MNKIRVLVEVRGGCVQRVAASTINIEVLILDYDNITDEQIDLNTKDCFVPVDYLPELTKL